MVHTGVLATQRVRAKTIAGNGLNTLVPRAPAGDYTRSQAPAWERTVFEALPPASLDLTMRRQTEPGNPLVAFAEKYRKKGNNNCHVSKVTYGFNINRYCIASWIHQLKMGQRMAKRRLQKYVDREVQSSLLRRLSVHWVLFMVANVMAITLWTKLVDTPMDPWSDTFTLSWQRLIPFALVSLALTPVFVWDAIKLSNRFAGPIVRVRHALAQIADGHSPKPIEFRNGDFWKSLAIDLNRAFAKNLVSKPASTIEKR